MISLAGFIVYRQLQDDITSCSTTNYPSGMAACAKEYEYYDLVQYSVSRATDARTCERSTRYHSGKLYTGNCKMTSLCVTGRIRPVRWWHPQMDIGIIFWRRMPLVGESMRKFARDLQNITAANCATAIYSNMRQSV